MLKAVLVSILDEVRKMAPNLGPQDILPGNPAPLFHATIPEQNREVFAEDENPDRNNIQGLEPGGLAKRVIQD